VWSWPLTSI